MATYETRYGSPSGLVAQGSGNQTLLSNLGSQQGYAATAPPTAVPDWQRMSQPSTVVPQGTQYGTGVPMAQPGATAGATQYQPPGAPTAQYGTGATQYQPPGATTGATQYQPPGAPTAQYGTGATQYPGGAAAGAQYPGAVPGAGGVRYPGAAAGAQYPGAQYQPPGATAGAQYPGATAQRPSLSQYSTVPGAGVRYPGAVPHAGVPGVAQQQYGGYPFKNAGYTMNQPGSQGVKGNFQYPQYVLEYAPMNGSKFLNFKGNPTCQYWKPHSMMLCTAAAKIKMMNDKLYCKEHARAIGRNWEKAENTNRPKDMNACSQPDTHLGNNLQTQMHHGAAPVPTMASLASLSGTHGSNLANQGAGALVGAGAQTQVPWTNSGPRSLLLPGTTVPTIPPSPARGYTANPIPLPAITKFLGWAPLPTPKNIMGDLPLPPINTPLTTDADLIVKMAELCVVPRSASTGGTHGPQTYPPIPSPSAPPTTAPPLPSTAVTGRPTLEQPPTLPSTAVPQAQATLGYNQPPSTAVPQASNVLGYNQPSAQAPSTLGYNQSPAPTPTAKIPSNLPTLPTSGEISPEDRR